MGAIQTFREGARGLQWGRGQCHHSPEHHNDGALAASDDDEPLPYHKGRGDDHGKIEDLVIQLHGTRECLYRLRCHINARRASSPQQRAAAPKPRCSCSHTPAALTHRQLPDTAAFQRPEMPSARGQPPPTPRGPRATCRLFMRRRSPKRSMAAPGQAPIPGSQPSSPAQPRSTTAPTAGAPGSPEVVVLFPTPPRSPPVSRQRRGLQFPACTAGRGPDARTPPARSCAGHCVGRGGSGPERGQTAARSEPRRCAGQQRGSSAAGLSSTAAPSGSGGCRAALAATVAAWAQRIGGRGAARGVR